MQPLEMKLRRNIDEARARHGAALDALTKVKELLAKADQRRLKEPQDARKWHRVIENLETSLDDTKKRVSAAELELLRLERELKEFRQHLERGEPTQTDSAEEHVSEEPQPDRSAPKNLEEAARLESTLDATGGGDVQLAASLELANQMGETYEIDGAGQTPRRQEALRGAIAKISQRQFDAMSHDEIKLVVACHSLLTRRLAPTPRDQRLKRILDGAIRVLERRKSGLDGED